MRIFIGIVLLLLLSGCADSVSLSGLTTLPEPAGFLLGIWHGIITPFAFAISLVDDTVSIYAVNNTGALYDFGFLLGVSTCLSVSSG